MVLVDGGEGQGEEKVDSVGVVDSGLFGVDGLEGTDRRVLSPDFFAETFFRARFRHELTGGVASRAFLVVDDFGGACLVIISLFNCSFFLPVSSTVASSSPMGRFKPPPLVNRDSGPLANDRRFSSSNRLTTASSVPRVERLMRDEDNLEEVNFEEEVDVKVEVEVDSKLDETLANCFLADGGGGGA